MIYAVNIHGVPLNVTMSSDGKISVEKAADFIPTKSIKEPLFKELDDDPSNGLIIDYLNADMESSVCLGVGGYCGGLCSNLFCYNAGGI